MKRYLIIRNYIDGTYTTDDLVKKHLLDLKDGVTKEVIDLEKEMYFDIKHNGWIMIKQKCLTA